MLIKGYIYIYIERERERKVVEMGRRTAKWSNRSIDWQVYKLPDYELIKVYIFSNYVNMHTITHGHLLTHLPTFINHDEWQWQTCLAVAAASFALQYWSSTSTWNALGPTGWYFGDFFIRDITFKVRLK